MGIEAPIPISTKLGDLSNLFQRIVNAAERPHLSIPETEAGRSRKQYHRLINRSLMFVSGMHMEFGIYTLCVFIFVTPSNFIVLRKEKNDLAHTSSVLAFVVNLGTSICK